MRKDLITLNLVFTLVALAVFIGYVPGVEAAGIHVPSNYDSIQSAINASANGDEIVVHPGTYYENINFSGKAITLRGTDPTNSSIVAATIIDGNQTDRVVTFNHGEGPDSILSGITLRNGNIPVSPGGGGIYCKQSCPSITYCIITGNSVTTYEHGSGGGGIHCEQSSPSISHCTIINNYAGRDGGGIFCIGFSFPVITHCTIYGNLTEYTGGAIFCYSSSPCITNCTVSGNSTEGIGGAIFCTASSFPYIVNSIFWGNGSEIFIDFGQYCNPRLSYCDVQGGYSGLGNIDKAPRFVAPSNGDYRLGSGSPCINTGHPRILDGNGSRSDMGAQGGEGGWQPDTITITVAADGSGNYTSIQNAIDYAVPGDKIMVLPGTYRENLVIGGKNLLLIGKGGIESTVIDGSESCTVILLVNAGAGSVLEGFTLRNGCTEDFGGGIGCCRSSPSISHCKIMDNFAKDGGGVFFIYSDSASIGNCIITGNSAALGRGGGIYCEHSSPSITHCTIAGNLSDGSTGGGIHCYFSSPAIIGCIIVENSAIWGGGIYCEDDSSPHLINCTISGNSASGNSVDAGGGIYCEYEASPTITNSILWNDTPDEIAVNNDVCTVTYSDIRGGYFGKGNIASDPGFIDPSAGDYNLNQGSPCMDKGNPNSLPSTDKDGTPRPQDGDNIGQVIFDMGAYEYLDSMPYEMDLSKGWNMISIPVIPNDVSVSELFHEAVVIYSFIKGSGYARVKKKKGLEIGRGYWIFLNETKKYTLTGKPILKYDRSVYWNGWDMVGGCSSPVQALVDKGKIEVIYRYVKGSGYQQVTAQEKLQPSIGYWILFADIPAQARFSMETTGY